MPPSLVAPPQAPRTSAISHVRYRNARFSTCSWNETFWSQTTGSGSGCHNEAPLTGGLRQQKCVPSPFRRRDVCGHCVSEGSVSSKASLLGLEGALFLPHLPLVFLCVSVSNLCRGYKERGRSMCTGRKRVHSLLLTGKSKSQDNMMLISAIPSGEETGSGARVGRGGLCLLVYVCLCGQLGYCQFFSPSLALALQPLPRWASYTRISLHH